MSGGDLRKGIGRVMQSWEEEEGEYQNLQLAVEFPDILFEEVIEDHDHQLTHELDSGNWDSLPPLQSLECTLSPPFQ